MLNYINDPTSQAIQADLAQAHTACQDAHAFIARLRTLRQPQEAEVLKLQICQLQQRLAILEAA